MNIKEIEPGLWICDDGRAFKEAKYNERGNRLNKYLFVAHNGKRHDVHRLVAKAFLENPNESPWVLHFDDDAKNNNVNNLRWGTPKDNAADMRRNAILNRRKPGNRIRKIYHSHIINELRDGKKYEDIARDWMVTGSAISQLVKKFKQQRLI